MTQQSGFNYTIKLKCGSVELDKEGTIQFVRMISDIGEFTPKISIALDVPSTSIVLNHIYGETQLELTISTIESVGEESLVFNLIYMQSNVSLIPVTPLEEEGVGSDPPQRILITTYIKECYELMSTPVNTIYEELDGETAGMNPIDALKASLDEFGVTGYDIDNRGINEEVIDQLLVPPMTVATMIEYLHEKYGLYKGPLHRFCRWDAKEQKCVLKLHDYSQIIQDEAQISIFQLSASQDDKQKEEQITEQNTEKFSQVFYTLNPVQSTHHTNMNLTKARYNKTQIIHPDDLLFHNIEYDMQKIADQYACTEFEKQLLVEESVKNSKKYCTDLKGFFRTEDALTSRMSNQIKNTFSIKVDLVRVLGFVHMIKVGYPAEFKPRPIGYQTYTGKYIIKSSDITWAKNQQYQWDCKASLVLFRSRPTKQSNVARAGSAESVQAEV